LKRRSSERGKERKKRPEDKARNCCVTKKKEKKLSKRKRRGQKKTGGKEREIQRRKVSIHVEKSKERMSTKQVWRGGGKGSEKCEERGGRKKTTLGGSVVLYRVWKKKNEKVERANWLASRGRQKKEKSGKDLSPQTGACSFAWGKCQKKTL